MEGRRWENDYIVFLDVHGDGRGRQRIDGIDQTPVTGFGEQTPDGSF
jgi:hypothetical protein